MSGSPRKSTTRRARPTTTRAAQRAGTREVIRKAAFELFSTVGFDQTTTQAIAERAGVATGTVFVHASDKADLLFLVMHDRLEAVVNAQFASVPRGAAFLDQLMHVFSAIYRCYEEHPKIGVAFVKHQPGEGPNAQRVNALTMNFLGRIAMLVGEAQASGEVAKELNPIACAQNIFGLYFMGLTAWIMGHAPSGQPLDALLRGALELQMRGLRP